MRTFFYKVLFLIYAFYMDYLSNIKNTYDIDFDNNIAFTHGALLMFSDGTVSDFIEYTPTANYTKFEEVVSYYINYGNRTLNKTTKMILYFNDYTGTYFLFTGENVDYYIIESIGCEGTFYTNCLNSNSEQEVLEDTNLVLGYARFNSYVTSYTYGNYNVPFDNGESFIFDLYNIKPFVNGATTYPKGQDNYYVVRGENTSVSKYFGDFGFDSLNTLRISYGSYYSDLYKEGFNDGYSDGYAGGWVNGNDNGFRVGQMSGNGMTTTEATAFTYIGGAFTAASDLLSVEVLPNITLGLVFSIPLTFILITTMFRLLKK